MCDSKPLGHLTTDKPRVVAQRGSVYWGAAFLPAVAMQVAIRDGIDSSGELIDRFNWSAVITDQARIHPKGIAIQSGLYVDFTEGTGPITIFYEPPTGRDA